MAPISLHSSVSCNIITFYDFSIADTIRYQKLGTSTLKVVEHRLKSREEHRIINAFALCCRIPMEICYCVVKTFQDCLSTLELHILLR